MKSLLTTFLMFLVFLSTAQTQFPLVPYPAHVTRQKGVFELPSSISIYNGLDNKSGLLVIKKLQEDLYRNWKISSSLINDQTKAHLKFNKKEGTETDKPAYLLSVSSEGISITANNNEGAFHSTRTLLQLVKINEDKKTIVPGVVVEDYPRFDYRGMHLDVGRHFYPIQFVKNYIDWLSFHKLNKFHWHLTEDQGWRIEIKKYPLLTEVGGWRNGTIIGRYPGRGNDNKRYGGFYTQNEIKEVVDYARERFIEVIPEIEMPGHSSAAIAAYPWLSCFPQKPTAIPATMISQRSKEEQAKGAIKLVQETWGVFDDVFCAGNDSTFAFLQDIIDEVILLFPSKYFHIGGDECPKTHWKICNRCQQRIKELGLKDEHELQSYFVQRIERYLNSKGKILIGWDEILEGGLAPNAIVMSWRGEAGGIEAAKQSHEVIMTPGNPVYFDHSQSENEDSVTIGGFNPLEKVYAYNPVPKEIPADKEKYVIGAQANVWTEYMNNEQKLEYMIFPRMAALSEALWTPLDKKSWTGFESRIPALLDRYQQWGVSLSKAYYDIKGKVVANSDFKGVQLQLSSKAAGGKITLSSPEKLTYEKPILITKTGLYQASFTDSVSGEIKSNYSQQFQINNATGKLITLTEPPSKTYAGDGAFTLVNGIQSKGGAGRYKDYLGYSGKNLEAQIDLGASLAVGNVGVSYLHQPSSWIYHPSAIEVWGSNDGQNFKSLAKKELEQPVLTENGTGVINLKTKGKYRYLKFLIKNKGIIEGPNPGQGNAAWLFVDELIVE